MIYIIYKILVLLKNHLNYLKDNIFKCFVKKCNRLLDIFLKNFFSQYIMIGNLSLEQENITKDIKNIFSLEKELDYTATKDVRNIFRLEKETKAIKYRIFRDIKNIFEEENH